MELINTVIERIAAHPKTSSSFVLASALASACNTRYSVSLLKASVSLDPNGKALFDRLTRITQELDYSNTAQDQALEWLHTNGFLKHIAYN